MESAKLSGGEMMAFATKIYNDKFKSCVVDKDDLIMQGVLGIVTYQDHYQPSRGKFSTYVGKCAYMQMLKYYNNEIKHIKTEICFEDLELYLPSKEKQSINNEITTLHSICNKFTNKPLKVAILNDLLADEKQVDIAHKYNISKQYVNIVWKHFCKFVNDNYYLFDGMIIKKENLADGECDR